MPHGCTPWKRDRITSRRQRSCGDIVLVEVENFGRHRFHWDIYTRKGGAGTRFGPWEVFSSGEESSLDKAKYAADRSLDWLRRVR